MSLLFPHLANFVKDITQESNFTSHTTGICLSVSLHHTCSSMRFRIVDSGVSHHIYSNVKAFVSLKPIQKSSVILSNNTNLPVHFCGDAKLNSKLFLQDVLFVPQFQVNLIPFGALTVTSTFIITFSENHCMM